MSEKKMLRLINNEDDNQLLSKFIDFLANNRPPLGTYEVIMRPPDNKKSNSQFPPVPR